MAYFHPPRWYRRTTIILHSKRKKSVFNWLDLEKKKLSLHRIIFIPIEQTYIIWTSGNKNKKEKMKTTTTISLHFLKIKITLHDITTARQQFHSKWSTIPVQFFPSTYDLFEEPPPSNSNRANLYLPFPLSSQLKLVNRRNDLPVNSVSSANSRTRQKLASIE